MSLKAISQLRTLLKPLSKDGFPSFVSQLESILVIMELRDCFVAPVYKCEYKDGLGVRENAAAPVNSSPSPDGGSSGSHGDGGEEGKNPDQGGGGEGEGLVENAGGDVGGGGSSSNGSGMNNNSGRPGGFDSGFRDLEARVQRSSGLGSGMAAGMAAISGSNMVISGCIFVPQDVFDSRIPGTANPKDIISLSNSDWLAFYSMLEAKAKTKRQRAHAVVKMAIGVNWHHLDVGMKDPALLWCRIRIEFEGTTFSRYFTLLRSMVGLKISDFGNDFTKYSSRLQDLFQSLLGLGREHSERDRVCFLLMGLDSSFDGVTTVIENLSEPTFYDSVVRINNYLERSVSRSSKPKKEKPKQLFGFNDRKENTFKGKCWGCDGYGHRKKDCPKNKPKREQKGHQKGNQLNLLDLSSFFMMTLATSLAMPPPEPKSKSKHYHDVVFDSGAARHLFNDKKWFISMDAANFGSDIVLGDGNTTMKVKGSGTVKMIMPSGNYLVLKNVGYVPELPGNFISQKRLVRDGYMIRFKYLNSKHDVIEVWHGKRLLGSTERDRDLYYLRAKPCTKLTLAAFKAKLFHDLSSWKWHLALGHLPEDSMRKLAQNVQGLVISTKPGADERICGACEEAGLRRLPFKPKSDELAHRYLPGEVLRSDLKSRIIRGKGGVINFAVFVDEGSRWLAAYDLTKKDIYDDYIVHVQWLERHTGRKLKFLCSDAGKEFDNARIRNWNEARGIELKLSAPECQSTNGIAERSIQTLMTMMRRSLEVCGLPVTFWPYCLQHAVYTKNRMPSSFLKGKTPYEELYGFKPDVSHMKPFGCVGWCRVPDQQQKKGGFGAKAVRCRLLGYEKTHGVYLVMLRDGRLARARHVRFLDTQFTFPDEDPDIMLDDDFFSPIPAENLQQGGMVGLDIMEAYEQAELKDYPVLHQKGSANTYKHANLTRTEHKDASHDASDVVVAAQPDPAAAAEAKDVSDEGEQSLRRSTRIRKPVVRFDPRVALNNGKGFKESENLNMMKLKKSETAHDLTKLYALGSIEPSEPKSYEEAVRDPGWQKSMEEEIQALEDNKTWIVVPISQAKGHKIITHTWVYKEKTNKDGVVVRLKSRLCARGFTQEGVTFSMKFAPTVKMSSIRLIITLALKRGMRIKQADINNAFLHGILGGVTYLEIPKGMRQRYSHKEYVLLLKKGIYGLKVSAAAWNAEFVTFMKSLGFEQCISDPCVFYKHHSGITIYLCLYVDDLIVVSDSEKCMDEVLSKIKAKYGLKDITGLDYILGIEAAKVPDGIVLNQTTYVEKILRRFGMENSNTKRVPLGASVQITKDEDGEDADEMLYRQKIGALAWITLGTRPDCAFALSKLSRYLNKPKKSHMLAADNVLRYLKGSKKHGILLRKNGESGLAVWVDSDWAGCKDTRRSTSGYVVTVHGNAIIWKSQRQTFPARSTAEAEYIACSEAFADAKWLKTLMNELGEEVQLPIPVYEDNEACIRIAENPVVSNRSKSIDIKYHVVRHWVAKQLFKMVDTNSKDQLADALTKAVTEYLLEQMKEAFMAKKE